MDFDKTINEINEKWQTLTRSLGEFERDTLKSRFEKAILGVGKMSDKAYQSHLEDFRTNDDDELEEVKAGFDKIKAATGEMLEELKDNLDDYDDEDEIYHDCYEDIFRYFGLTKAFETCIDGLLSEDEITLRNNIHTRTLKETIEKKVNNAYEAIVAMYED